MGNDLVMKVISPGKNDASSSDNLSDAKDQAEVGDVITIDFKGYQLLSFDGDGTNTEELPFLEKERCIIALGDGDVVPGLEMATRFLGSGDEAIVKCRSKYAYGAGGRRRADSSSKSNLKDLPSNSDVVFTVCMRDIIPPRRLFETDDLRLRLASSKKQLGNECYQYEWDEHGMGKAKALKLYGKARDIMIDLIGEIENRNGGDSAADTNNATKRKANAMLIDCLNNISAVHLKAKSYGLAKDSAATVLQYDPNNIKALCRAARAAIFDPAGTFKECEAAIACAEETDPDNADVKRLRVDLDRRKKLHKKREKAMYSKMMVGGSSCRELKQSAQEGSEEDGNHHARTTTKATMDTPPAYLYLFASFLITLGTLLLFQIVSSINADSNEL